MATLRAMATAEPAGSAVAPPGPPETAVEGAPQPIIGRIVQEAWRGSGGVRFQAYAMVNNVWLGASLDSVRTIFLQGDKEVKAALAGGLGRFTGLTLVCIRGYPGSELPAAFGAGLSRLEALQVNCPNLTALPDSIGEMVSLKKLSLSGLEKLVSLPPSLSQLTNLASLDVRDCPAFPDGTFAALTSLKHLRLLAPTLRQIPGSIQDLPHLETLHMSGEGMVSDQGATFPVTRGLGNLKRLCVPCPGWGVPLAPLSLTMLTSLQSLERLDLYSFVLPDGIPECLGRLPMLRFLSLKVSCLASLSPGFPQLKSLKLYLSRDPTLIQNLPLPASSYPCLKDLTIRGGFSSLPSVLCEVTTLESLDIASLFLRELPRTIGQLVNLRVLKLAAYSVNEIPQEGTFIRALESFTCDSSVRHLPLSPTWSLKLLHVSKCPNLVKFDCGGGSVAVKELHVSCRQAADQNPDPLIQEAVVGELQVLKVNCPDSSYRSHSTCLPPAMDCMTGLQFLDLSKAPCVSGFSSCSELVSLKEVQLSPEWPQRIPTDSRDAAVRSAIKD